MKRVRDNEYVSTLAIWEQSNIFIIICRGITCIPAQSQQRNDET